MKKKEMKKRKRKKEIKKKEKMKIYIKNINKKVQPLWYSIQ
jgi:hypothetical protein